MQHTANCKNSFHLLFQYKTRQCFLSAFFISEIIVPNISNFGAFGPYKNKRRFFYERNFVFSCKWPIYYNSATVWPITSSLTYELNTLQAHFTCKDYNEDTNQNQRQQVFYRNNSFCKEETKTQAIVLTNCPHFVIYNHLFQVARESIATK